MACGQNLAFRWHGVELLKNTHMLTFVHPTLDQLTMNLLYKEVQGNLGNHCIASKVKIHTERTIRVPFGKGTRTFILTGVIYHNDENIGCRGQGGHYICITARKEEEDGKYKTVYYVCDDQSIRRFENNKDIQERFPKGRACGSVYVSQDAWNAKKVTSKPPVPFPNCMQERELCMLCFFNSCLQVFSPSICSILDLMGDQFTQNMMVKDDYDNSVLYKFLLECSRIDLSFAGALKSRANVVDIMIEASKKRAMRNPITVWAEGDEIYDKRPAGEQQDAMEMFAKMIEFIEEEVKENHPALLSLRNSLMVKRFYSDVCTNNHTSKIFEQEVISYLGTELMSSANPQSFAPPDVYHFNSLLAYETIVQYKEKLSENPTMETYTTLFNENKDHYFRTKMSDIVNGIFESRHGLGGAVEKKHNLHKYDLTCMIELVGDTFESIHTGLIESLQSERSKNSEERYPLVTRNAFRFEGGLGYGVPASLFPEHFNKFMNNRNVLTASIFDGKEDYRCDWGSEADLLAYSLAHSHHLCYVAVNFHEAPDEHFDDELEFWTSELPTADDVLTAEEFTHDFPYIDLDSLAKKKELNVDSLYDDKSRFCGRIIQHSSRNLENGRLVSFKAQTYHIFCVPLIFSIEHDPPSMKDAPFAVREGGPAYSRSNFLHEFVFSRLLSFIQKNTDGRGSYLRLVNPLLREIVVKNEKISIDERNGNIYTKRIYSNEVPVEFVYDSKLMLLPYSMAIEEASTQEQAEKHGETVRVHLMEKCFKLIVFPNLEDAPHHLVIRDELGLSFEMSMKDLLEQNKNFAGFALSSKLCMTKNSEDFIQFGEERVEISRNDFKFSMDSNQQFISSMLEFTLYPEDVQFMRDGAVRFHLKTQTSPVEAQFQIANLYLRVPFLCSFYSDGAIEKEKESDFTLENNDADALPTQHLEFSAEGAFSSRFEDQEFVVVQSSLLYSKKVVIENVIASFSYLSPEKGTIRRNIGRSRLKSESWISCVNDSIFPRSGRQMEQLIRAVLPNVCSMPNALIAKLLRVITKVKSCSVRE